MLSVAIHTRGGAEAAEDTPTDASAEDTPTDASAEDTPADASAEDTPADASASAPVSASPSGAGFSPSGRDASSRFARATSFSPASFSTGSFAGSFPLAPPPIGDHTTIDLSMLAVMSAGGASGRSAGFHFADSTQSSCPRSAASRSHATRSSPPNSRAGGFGGAASVANPAPNPLLSFPPSPVAMGTGLSRRMRHTRAVRSCDALANSSDPSAASRRKLRSRTQSACPRSVSTRSAINNATPRERASAATPRSPGRPRSPRHAASGAVSHRYTRIAPDASPTATATTESNASGGSGSSPVGSSSPPKVLFPNAITGGGLPLADAPPAPPPDRGETAGGGMRSTASASGR